MILQKIAVKGHNEIMAAHWVSQQITLFTAFAWISDNHTESFLVLSDKTEHENLWLQHVSPN